jgi:transposase
MNTRRKFTKEFKQTAVRRLEGGQSLAEVARALEVHASDLSRWRRELQEHGERAFSGVGKKRAEERRVPELERKIGQQAMEIDFLNRTSPLYEALVAGNYWSLRVCSFRRPSSYTHVN